MKNTITVSIWCNTDGLSVIKRTPTLSSLFAPNQLQQLKANSNVQMNVSKPTYARMMNLLNTTNFNNAKNFSCTKILTSKN